MAEQDQEFDVQFMHLVMSLHAAAMQQMGKLMSPITGKIERDLTLAKQSIDLLDMIKRKTAGNLSAQEQMLLDRLLYELQMNYVDESRKGDSDQSVDPKKAEQPEQPGQPEQSAQSEPGESADSSGAGTGAPKEDN